MSENPIRVAVAGVGNCATSLIQGVHFYRDADPSDSVPGLMHVQFGDYHVRDVQFVAAFDVDAAKVGLDLSQAILAGENNTMEIAKVPPLDVTVDRGPTLDGLGQYYRETITESDAEPVDVTHPQVVGATGMVGSCRATRVLLLARARGEQEDGDRPEGGPGDDRPQAR